MYTSFQNDKFCHSFVFMIIGPECISSSDFFNYDCYSVVHHWHLHLIFLSFHLLFVLHKQQLNFLVTLRKINASTGNLNYQCNRSHCVWLQVVFNFGPRRGRKRQRSICCGTEISFFDYLHFLEKPSRLSNLYQPVLSGQ